MWPTPTSSLLQVPAWEHPPLVRLPGPHPRAPIPAGAGVAGVPSYSGCLRPGWVTCLFISSDVFSLVVQSSGAGLMVSQSADSARLGKTIIIGGLALQLLFFFAFLLVTIHLHRTAYRGPAGTPYAPVLRCLYACVALLTARNCYRVAEFQQARAGQGAARTSPLRSRQGSQHPAPGSCRLRTLAMRHWRCMRQVVYMRACVALPPACRAWTATWPPTKPSTTPLTSPSSSCAACS